MQWLERLVAFARRLTRTARPQVIAGEGAVALESLRPAVAELSALAALAARVKDGQPLVFPRHHALDRLLATTAATGGAHVFVEQQIGPLLTWDRENGGDLLTVLEAALDHARHDRAAAECFMHRNTFRHRLRQAQTVLGTDVQDPDVRLAVHVALKLRRVIEASPAPAR